MKLTIKVNVTRQAFQELFNSPTANIIDEARKELHNSKLAINLISTRVVPYEGAYLLDVNGDSFKFNTLFKGTGEHTKFLNVGTIEVSDADYDKIKHLLGFDTQIKVYIEDEDLLTYEWDVKRNEETEEITSVRRQLYYNMDVIYDKLAEYSASEKHIIL